MCGIYFCLFPKLASQNVEQKYPRCHNFLQHRGPDMNDSISISVDELWEAQFSAYVLWMQGDEPTSQPVQDEAGNVLLWNGDVFNRSDNDVPEQSSDTTFLLESFSKACSDPDNHEDKILEVLGSIEGPWSFIFWDSRRKQVWFGRDALGRHSLLWYSNLESSPAFIITSVASRSELPDCKELPATGVFVASVQDKNIRVKMYPWNSATLVEGVYAQDDFPPNLEIMKTSHLVSPYATFNLSAPDANDSIFEKLKSLSFMSLKTKEIFQYLLQDRNILDQVDKLRTTLIDAIQVRAKTQPNICRDCISVRTSQPKHEFEANCSHSKVAILFSGGLDSAVLAALADSCVAPGETIDLINIAFHKERKPVNRKERRNQENLINSTDTISGGFGTNPQFDVPDRITGKITYQELLLIQPLRPWNFLEINVTKEELVEARQSRIADLIHPRRTVLDDSLGCAVWFASRGIGILHQRGGSKIEQYHCPARVLLLGMGADELLGGYSRCRKLLSRSDQDWGALALSMQRDVASLPCRNLGRDDRVACDAGRQARYPFLAENVVRFLANLPAHVRTAPLPFLPLGVGEKLLLRLLATQIGLCNAAAAPKRALQFGSKVAGLEARSERGDDECPRLLLNP